MFSTSILAASTKRHDAKESLSEVAFRQIKDKIITLELPPASLLDESKLAEELGLGLTPIRQALRKLEMKNLVVILPRRGTLVADLNLSDLQKIHEIRTEMEVLGATLAATRATSEQITELQSLAEQSIKATSEVSNQDLIELDRRVHLLIAEASQNEFLLETTEWLYNHVQRLWNLTLDDVNDMAKAVSEHHGLVAAIAAGNSELAGSLMRIHVKHFQTEFAKTIKGLDL